MSDKEKPARLPEKPPERREPPRERPPLAEDHMPRKDSWDKSTKVTDWDRPRPPKKG
jgi:hypothetical protein